MFLFFAPPRLSIYMGPSVHSESEFESFPLITCTLAATAGATPGPRCFCQAHFELHRAFAQTFIPLIARVSLETGCLQMLKEERNNTLHQQ